MSKLVNTGMIKVFIWEYLCNYEAKILFKSIFFVFVVFILI